jgi:hypothetical protein
MVVKSIGVEGARRGGERGQFQEAHANLCAMTVSTSTHVSWR